MVMCFGSAEIGSKRELGGRGRGERGGEVKGLEMSLSGNTYE